MDITTRMQHGVTLVVFAGSLDSNTSPKAQQEIDGVLGAGAKKVAIDCTGLDYISSAGLRVMLGTAKKLNGAGRSEEHTSELQSHVNLVCRLLLEKKK